MFSFTSSTARQLKFFPVLCPTTVWERWWLTSLRSENHCSGWRMWRRDCQRTSPSYRWRLWPKIVFLFLFSYNKSLKKIPFFFTQVDAHNIVPCWVASPKLEYAARTIRGKITKHLTEFLTGFPLVERHPFTAREKAKVSGENFQIVVLFIFWCDVLKKETRPLLIHPFSTLQKIDWDQTLSSLKVDRTVKETNWAQPGTCGGMAMLESFIDFRLKLFGNQRNDPNINALSQLSPWIHFGQFVMTQMSRLLG